MSTRPVIWAAMAAMLACAPAAWGADPIAYITEIQRPAGKGEVLVHVATEGRWKPPQPLLALRAGDQIKVTGAARVVVLYHGGGTAAVSAQTSPFTVQPAVARDKAAPAQVTAALTEFFLGKQGPPTFKGAVTRGTGPVIVSPRHTRLFPGAPVFEWDGVPGRPYTVRVIDAQGVRWEQAQATSPLPYAVTAPPLQAGVRYTWELETPGQPPQRTEFEVVSDAEAARVRDALSAIDRTVQPGYAAGTVTVMRTAIFFEEGLFADARQELEAAERRSPDDPTLPFLLTHVYEHIGLTAKARHAFQRAQERGR